MSIPKIVITGGPCAGKTKGLAYLIKKLSSRGFMVFTIPEIPTLLFNGGLTPLKMENEEQVFEFEKTVVAMQLSFEKMIEAAAAKIYPHTKKVILCDRGAMDHKAYFPSVESWERLLKEREYDLVDLRDGYVGVVHLVSTALGAEEFYSLCNNPARSETPEQAIERDAKTRECWNGHRCLKVIDNSTGFRRKMDRAFAAIRGFLNVS